MKVGIEVKFTALEQLKNSKRFVEKALRRIIDRLANEGYVVASAGFKTAQYDGINDSVVSVTWENETTAVLRAEGQAVLFIEFGTGVYQPDYPEEEKPAGMDRGEYGKGYGKQKLWGYYGEPGTNGIVTRNRQGREVVLTRGNPPGLGMYNAKKHIEDRLLDIATEELTG